MKSKIFFLLFLIIFSIISCTSNQSSIKTDSNIETSQVNNNDMNEVKEETNDKDKESELDLGSGELKIERRPPLANFGRGKLLSLPKYDPKSNKMWQVDLRGYDLSGLDIKDRAEDLLFSSFDSKTKWPEEMPLNFNIEEIISNGVNPGLNIKKLHEQGVTGEGVGIAIIDQALLVDHIEYKNQLKMYEEIHCLDSNAQMHGPAVASIAVGKTVGVAPDADLYYIAETHGNVNDGEFEWDFTYLAKSIDRIVEVNKTLPKNNKIRVISISVGWSSSQKGYKEVMAAVDRAKKEGIFVVSCSLDQTYGLNFHALGREPLENPDEFKSYEPGLWWENQFYRGNYEGKRMLLVPMDSRTTASPTGNDDYVFYREGGWSWSVPYIAGLYALACQTKPDMTPYTFWTNAFITGESIEIEKDERKYKLEKIVNPVKLIGKIKGIE